MSNATDWCSTILCKSTSPLRYDNNTLMKLSILVQNKRLGKVKFEAKYLIELSELKS